jgi:hypothetical protein
MQMTCFEKLFQGDDDWGNNACLNFMRPSFDLYATGYLQAAERLVEHVVATQQNQDTLVYPITFLYRQYLELRLKQILKEGRILLEEKQVIPNGHDLRPLWREVKRICDKVFEEPDGKSLEEFEYVSHIVKEFVALDKISFAFRYPIDKKGKNSLPEVHHINVRRLADMIGRAGGFLDGVSYAIGVHRDMQDDMRF